MKALLTLVCFLLLICVAPAEARQIDFGITDTGNAKHFKREASRLDFRFPAIQTFHPWGNSLNQAIPRWRELGATPYLHISTADDETREELITPWGISRGDGDRYLIDLNAELDQFDAPAVIRPLGEPNRLWNPYCAFRPDGKPRNWQHRQKFYRKAFRRIYLIVHGGSRRKINEKLRRMKLPVIQVETETVLPEPKVKVLWSPLPGSANIEGNSPQDYWPGPWFVDMVGTSFYSAWPYWSDLTRFYRTYAAGRFPFSLAEWGLLADDPQFSGKLIDWCARRYRCQSMFYYRGFDGRYELRNFPGSLEKIKSELRRPVFRELDEWGS